MAKDSLPTLIGALLHKNSIPFVSDELALQIKGHPSYPSLHAITGVLTHFNIENVAASVPVEEASLDHLPQTFLAQVNEDIAVVIQTKTGLEILTSSMKTKKMTASEFLEGFSGVVVVVEKDELAKKEVKGNGKLFFTMAVTLMVIAAMLLAQPGIVQIIYLALSLVGVVVSYTIWKQESGENTFIGEALCGDPGQLKDCNAVLHSNGANLLGKYKVTDLSIAYFTTFSMVGFLFIIFQASIQVLHYVSLMVLPVTLYTVYYQWLVIKKWCLLCLTITGLLWTQAFVSGFALDPWTLPSITDGLLLGLTGVLTFMGWQAIRQRTERLSSTENKLSQSLKFRRNFKVFQHLFLEKKPIGEETIAGEIILGNTAAPVSIMVVTNPFCIHCKAVHQSIEKIVAHYSELASIVIRFNVNVEDPRSDGARVTARLLEIYHADGPQQCRQAMNDIYGDYRSDKWLLKWGECQYPASYLEIAQNGQAWCAAHDINFTPEILINGRPYPESYPREDLPYFIEDLYEIEGINDKPEINDMPQLNYQ